MDVNGVRLHCVVEGEGPLVLLNCPHPAVMQRALRSNWTQLRKSWYIFAFQLPWLPEWSFRQNGAKALKDVLRRTAKWTDTRSTTAGRREAHCPSSRPQGR